MPQPFWLECRQDKISRQQHSCRLGKEKPQSFHDTNCRWRAKILPCKVRVHMKSSRQTIYIQPLAPPKPGEGAACNGCGMCCLAEPCPLGVLLSWRRRGPCDALRWQTGDKLYRCGAISEPKSVLQDALPGLFHGLIPALSFLLGSLAARWVAAGAVCDSTLESVAPQPRSPDE